VRRVTSPAPAEAEPDLGPWRVVDFAAFARTVLAHVGAPSGRPPVLAIDGRGSGGKTTLARRLAATLPGIATVHTDDIAWWHSPFGWVDLMRGGVLEPLRRGEAVAYRPPAWDTRGRPGAVEVPAGARLVIVEGVGAGRRELVDLLDGIVFVQTDLAVTQARDAVRVAAGEIDEENYAAWMAEEHPFVLEQRAWERAFAVVAGSPELPYDAEREIVVGTPLV
jgi:hypothetical protein